MKEATSHENPLIPNEKLRQMFVAMVEMRLLDEHIARVQRRVKPRLRLESTRGEEACRVSTAIGLGAGDLVSDSHDGVAMEHLLGAKIGPLLQRVAKAAARPRPVGAENLVRLLPWIEEVEERLRMAMGAALSFRTLGQTTLVTAYVRDGEVSRRSWREILKLAARFELPMLFVVLPDESRKRKRREETGALSGLARVCGVPGIPVDASDAVALYRVAQESIGRARGGGGPVLVECVAYRPAGDLAAKLVDPLEQMMGFLLGRKVAERAWLKGAGHGFKAQVARAVAKSSRRVR